MLEGGALRLNVPPGALDTALTITMRSATTADLPVPLPAGVGFAGAVFSPSGLSFAASATVSVQLPTPTITPALPVVTYDEGLSAWVGTGATAAVAANGVDAEFPVSHFSIAGVPDAVPIPDPGDPIEPFVVLSNNGVLQTDAINSDSAALLWSEFGDSFSISATSQNINDEGQLETKAIGFTSITVFRIENYIAGVVGGPASLFDPGGLPEPAVGVMIMSVKDGNVALSLYAATEKRVIQGTLTSPPAGR